MPPSVYETLPEACSCRVEAGQENRSSATEPVVEWDSEPATKNGTAKIWTGVGQTEEPGGVVAGNTEVLGVEDLCAVYNGFICDIPA